MTADRGFVSTSGTKHQGERAFDEFITDCRMVFKVGIVKQGWVKDCKRCYPKGGVQDGAGDG